MKYVLLIVTIFSLASCGIAKRAARSPLILLAYSDSAKECELAITANLSDYIVSEYIGK